MAEGFIANLGDENPLSYGGYFIYEAGPDPRSKKRPTQDWSPKDRERDVRYYAQLLVPVDDAPYLIYTFQLDRLKLVDGFLVPFRYESSWPHPPERYDEWFADSIPKMAESVGLPAEELREMFTSADPLELARAYEIVGSYHGWENLDSYPLSVTQEEAEQRYQEELRRS